VVFYRTTYRQWVLFKVMYIWIAQKPTNNLPTSFVSVIWPRSNGSGCINKTTPWRALLYSDGWPFARTPSWYVTSHSGQLSVLPSVGRERSTRRGPVAVLRRREGNCMPDVASPTCHRFCGIFSHGLKGLTKEHEHLAYTPVGPQHHLPFTGP